MKGLHIIHWEEIQGQSLAEFIKSRKTFILFCLFGGFATILETILYWVLYEVMGVSNTLSTAISWFVIVFFCFYTNKCFVYVSKEWSFMKVLKELLGFFSCRTATGIFDVVFMYLAVDVMDWEPISMRVLAATLAGIINYLVGKRFIFR